MRSPRGSWWGVVAFLAIPVVLLHAASNGAGSTCRPSPMCFRVMLLVFTRSSRRLVVYADQALCTPHGPNLASQVVPSLRRVSFGPHLSTIHPVAIHRLRRRHGPATDRRWRRMIVSIAFGLLFWLQIRCGRWPVVPFGARSLGGK